MLASNSIYVSTAHSKKIIEEYLFYLDKIFNLIAKCENGLKIDSLLKTRVCHSGFQRVN